MPSLLSSNIVIDKAFKFKSPITREFITLVLLTTIKSPGFNNLVKSNVI